MNASRIAVALTAAAIGAGALAGTNDFYVTGYGSFDISSGYVLYGARENNEPCYWTYGELNAGYGRFGSLGASLWQNSDMTGRRKDVMRRAGEWDWAVFGRTGIDVADGWRLALEAGHQWYVYAGVKPDYVDSYHTMGEWYGRVALENPFVTPYFEYYYDHLVYEGAFMQGGLRHAFELPFGFLLTPDLTVGGGDRNYNSCMYPPFDGSVAGGITYVQVSALLQYWFNDHFGVHARIAYVSLANGDIRDAVDEYGSPYANDHVWGTIGVDVAF